MDKSHIISHTCDAITLEQGDSFPANESQMEPHGKYEVTPEMVRTDFRLA